MIKITEAICYYQNLNLYFYYRVRLDENGERDRGVGAIVEGQEERGEREKTAVCVKKKKNKHLGII